MFLEMCYQSLSDVAAEPSDHFSWDYDEPILDDSFGIPLSLHPDSIVSNVFDSDTW